MEFNEGYCFQNMRTSARLDDKDVRADEVFKTAKDLMRGESLVTSMTGILQTGRPAPCLVPSTW